MKLWPRRVPNVSMATPANLKCGSSCRDGRLISIGGGADEVMLEIISKYMDTLPRK